MSIPLPHDLRIMILSYIPISILVKFKLSKDSVVDLVISRYKLLRGIVTPAVMNNTVLSPRLILMKIATLCGESMPGQEALFNPGLCLINAIFNNNLDMVMYYFQRADLNSRLFSIMYSILAMEHRCKESIVSLLTPKAGGGIVRSGSGNYVR